MTVCLSKRRYHAIKDEIANYLQDADKAEGVLTIIKTILKYDETASTYNPEVGRRIKEYRDRMREQGVSTYVTSGKKSQYQKKKASSQVD